ncbi:helix-turn-helix domain-containing protein [Sinorhizobium garamanticum]|uniref:Helix-turn-helix domain-containing protein n=1 Tax=Sinorhizobium garamanticum TaxID=680247 RepID=A0ABY8DGC2_9HYPH|nr:helix-turn-helix domain-containing protein [Sinorhizobium garamanticum]WEX89934.1 helix-turn-helix domain-containing protein [Sinorhizobium garamanticum]
MVAWINLCLKLVDRLPGTAVMLAKARFMLVDPAWRTELLQRLCPQARSRRPGHPEGPTLAAREQHQGRGAVDDGRSRRPWRTHFLRRFQKATGLNPAEYCQRLRIAKSRELLERSCLSIAQVPWQSGYEDTKTYRKIFRKILGVSPKEYRPRFSVVDTTRHATA